MRSKRDVWTATVVGVVVGVVGFASLWDSMGDDIRLGRAGDFALGAWSTFTVNGQHLWLAYALSGAVCGFVAYLIGKTSLNGRREREERAARTAAAPHPMD